MTSFVLVFLAALGADICWTVYFQKVAAEKAVAAASWSAAIVACGAFSVVEYARNPWLVTAAIVGSWCGTYLTMQWPKIKAAIKRFGEYDYP